MTLILPTGIKLRLERMADYDFIKHTDSNLVKLVCVLASFFFCFGMKEFEFELIAY